MPLHQLQESEDYWRRVTLDTKKNLLYFDLTNLVGTAEAVSEVISAGTRLALACREKPYAVINWNGCALTVAGSQEYKKSIPALMSLVRVAVRYGMTNSLSRVVVRTVGVARNLKNSYLCATKDEAMAFVRADREAERLAENQL